MPGGPASVRCLRPPIYIPLRIPIVLPRRQPAVGKEDALDRYPVVPRYPFLHQVCELAIEPLSTAS